MTKRSGIRLTQEENQADLFGGGTPSTAASPKKKARTARRSTQTLAAPRSTQSEKPVRPDVLLNVRQAAARLGLSKSTLDKMRGAGKGPRFIRSTDRAIRYDPADLDRWINARRSMSD